MLHHVQLREAQRLRSMRFSFTLQLEMSGKRLACSETPLQEQETHFCAEAQHQPLPRDFLRSQQRFTEARLDRNGSLHAYERGTSCCTGKMKERAMLRLLFGSDATQTTDKYYTFRNLVRDFDLTDRLVITRRQDYLGQPGNQCIQIMVADKAGNDFPGPFLATRPLPDGRGCQQAT